MGDAPDPDLVAALGALAPYVVEVVEQPVDFVKGLCVRKVSWTWKWDKEQGQHVPKVTVHATKVLVNNNSPWNVISPLSDPGDEFGEALALVHNEALEYVDGKREQGTLPLEEGEEGNEDGEGTDE